MGYNIKGNDYNVTLSCWETVSSWLLRVTRGTPVWEGSPSIANELWVARYAYLLNGNELFCINKEI